MFRSQTRICRQIMDRPELLLKKKSIALKPVLFRISSLVLVNNEYHLV